MDIKFLQDNNLIIFEAISGSHAYGTAEPTSDLDKKGVFVLPLDTLLSGDYVPQVSDENNDITYFELGRFLELLSKGNPTAIELLFSPEDVILHKNPLMDRILEKKELFINKQLKNTFGEYAKTQIYKARGLNKKIVNPVDEVKKTPLDFCYIIDGYKSYALKTFLDNKGYDQKFCGVVKVPNAEGIFALFFDEFSYACFYEGLPEDVRESNKKLYKNNFKGYKGIIKEDENGEFISNEIRLSSIPKGQTPVCLFTYNKNGYTIYCKDYKDYWDWVKYRNQNRYNTNAKHGKGYDGKNLSHCHRLLDMCVDVGLGKGIIVKRDNVKKLLDIKHGLYDYDELIKEAMGKIDTIKELFESSTLPEDCDQEQMKQLLVELRKKFYSI